MNVLIEEMRSAQGKDEKRRILLKYCYFYIESQWRLRAYTQLEKTKTVSVNRKISTYIIGTFVSTKNEN